MITSAGYNLDSGTSCALAGTGDLVGVNPLLGALASNGGPTQTHALQSGSPALNAGNPGGCRDANGAALSIDQTGRARPETAGGRCDIGAYEVPAASSGSSGGGGGGGGSCFIATAAFGSYLHPHVQSLRNFRDDYLLTNAPGRTFVRLYYAYSPALADVIAEHASLRAATRVVLTPVIFAVEYSGQSFGLMILFMTGVMLIRRRLSRAALTGTGASREGRLFNLFPSADKFRGDGRRARSGCEWPCPESRR